MVMCWCTCAYPTCVPAFRRVAIWSAVWMHYLGYRRVEKPSLPKPGQHSMVPSWVLFVASSSSLSYHGECVHGRSGEHTSNTLSAQILHREAGDQVFGEHHGATTLMVLVLPHRLTSLLPTYFLVNLLPLRAQRPRQNHRQHQQWTCWCRGGNLPGCVVRASYFLLRTSSCSICRSNRCT
jgi:hypothetical protein